MPSGTDRFFLLNGDWSFRYFDSIYDCQEASYEEGYDTRHFDTLPVPSNWQDHGYDIHQYTNTRYPFPFDPPYVPHENPCGAYVRSFTYKKPEGTATYHLNFEGVDSCLYVMVTAPLSDIIRFLIPPVNLILRTLCVKVKHTCRSRSEMV